MFVFGDLGGSPDSRDGTSPAPLLILKQVYLEFL